MDIMRRLCIPASSHQCVRTILHHVLQANEQAIVYNPKVGLTERGRSPLIVDYSEQSQVVYSAVSAGLSVAQTTIMLNEYRDRLEVCEGPICLSAVNRFVTDSKAIDKSKRQSKKCGTDDPHSVWARARGAQSGQFLGQLYGNDEEGIPPAKFHAIAFWDENHKEV